MRPQELNLLMIFDAIMTERSITRAADRLSMTQPAVSNAVSRMRVAWKDELFVKDGRNIQPTLHAQNLWEQVHQPLSHLTDAIDPSAFDPASAKRTFRIAVSDNVVDIAWLALRKLIEREAPGINIHAIPYTIVNTEQVLNDAKVDMVVGVGFPLSRNIRTEHLYSPQYVCVMRNGHPLAKPDMSLAEFAAADHLLVSLSGETTGFIDQMLLQQGLSRRIAFTVNHFSAVSPILKDSDLVAIMPTGSVEKALMDNQLAATKPPVDFPPKQLAMLWHERQDRDSGLLWLRKHLKAIVMDEVTRHTNVVMSCLCKASPAQCPELEKSLLQQSLKSTG